MYSAKLTGRIIVLLTFAKILALVIIIIGKIKICANSCFFIIKLVLFKIFFYTT